MKIDQAHIDQIRKQFAELQSKEDLVKLLSNAKNMLYGEGCKPVQLKSLTYYANPGLCKKRYKTFTIKKKSGADRTIHAPVKGLKSILRSLNFVLQCIYKPHEAATGFVLNKSIVDNAKRHVGHHYVLNMDLKDFFHSFDLYRVKFGLLRELWGINNILKYQEKKKDDFMQKDEIAFVIACLCTHPFTIDGEVQSVLPQGSPTSPTLTNILCAKLDRRLYGLANRFGATFTRYADDITFSSSHNIYQQVENPVLNEKGTYDDFISELGRLIKEEKLVINPMKTRLQKAGYRQEATGLIVNDKVNVRRRYVKQIRMWLYYWEKYGYEKANQIFKRNYIADKGHVKNINAHLVNVLDGKLEFLKMVKGIEDGTYKGLKVRFVELTGLKDKKDNEKIDLESVVNTILNKGLDEGINLYDRFKNS
jgi:RNA-directed DNA polymerase